MKHDPFANLVLDEEEQDLENNFHNQAELAPEAAAKMNVLFKSAAINSTKKTKTIGIRISEGMLMSLKTIADEEGLKYQSLIHTILHKFVQERVKHA